MPPVTPKRVAILSGWALPGTVFMAAVSAFYVPWWYVGVQIVMGMYAEDQAHTLTRKRAAGLLQMGAMTVLAVALKFQWTWTLWVVLPLIFAAVMVAATGKRGAT